MAPATSLVSVQEYLATDYMPNAEYEDGVVTPKPMPTYLHNRLVRELMMLIMHHNPNLDPIQEQHVQVREGKFLIPDLIAQRVDQIQSPYPNTPFPLCVEVLSPDDRISAVFQKCEAYVKFGVPTTWIIDPVSRRAWIFDAACLPTEVPAHGHLTAENLSIPLAELFARLPNNL